MRMGTLAKSELTSKLGFDAGPGEKGTLRIEYRNDRYKASSKQKFENTFYEEPDNFLAAHVAQTKGIGACFWVAQEEAVHVLGLGLATSRYVVLGRRVSGAS